VCPLNTHEFNLELSLYEGDLISITTNKGIAISSKIVTSLKIAVVESDTTKIKGGVVAFYIDDEGDGDIDETMEFHRDSMVEIMRADINNIWIWK
jgi:hypothetical protein